MTFNLSLDLGGDSLKIAYAYTTQAGEFKYGKITASDSLVRVAFPAVAFFDDESGSWIYGNMVDRQSNTSFVKVVKIKDLLSLLQNEDNAVYYDDKNFPKFFFPRNANAFDDFAQAIKENKTFVTELTCREVCQNFFRYIKLIVDQGKNALEKKNSIKFRDTNISVIYPPKANKPYINELVRLVTEAFGIVPCKILSSTKALGTYVKHMKKINVDHNLLVFDMGEEDISVSKIFVNSDGELFVDGIEGHMAPLHIGGINIDYAIAEYTQNEIRERDTVGTPSSGSNVSGHVYEDALITKQYLFMRSIKKAKVILSLPSDEDSVFVHGAPIGIFYELFIQRNLTHEMIADCIGTANNTGLAKQILNYITEELRKPLNSDLTSNATLAREEPIYDYGYIVLSGGLSDTFSLKQYIEAHLQRDFPDLKILDLSTFSSGEDEFSILPNESAAYAASVGGALVALYDEDVKTMLSFSYGTWVNVDGEKCLGIFIDRGRILSRNNAFTIKYGFSGSVSGERLYSTVVTSKDIQKGSFRGRPLDIKTSSEGKCYLRIGEENSPFRRSIKDFFKLQTVAGDDNAEIAAYYNGEEIVRFCQENSTRDDHIVVNQGINVDDNGKISPFYGVSPSERDHHVKVITRNRRTYDSVPATSIIIRGPKISTKASQS